MRPLERLLREGDAQDVEPSGTDARRLEARLAHGAIGPSHNIGQMAAALPVGHPWRPKLAALDRLSPAATTYRYPTPGGRVAPPPSPADLDTDIDRIERLLRDATRDLSS